MKIHLLSATLLCIAAVNYAAHDNGTRISIGNVHAPNGVEIIAAGKPTSIAIIGEKEREKEEESDSEREASLELARTFMRDHHDASFLTDETTYSARTCSCWGWLLGFKFWHTEPNNNETLHESTVSVYEEEPVLMPLFDVADIKGYVTISVDRPAHRISDITFGNPRYIDGSFTALSYTCADGTPVSLIVRSEQDKDTVRLLASIRHLAPDNLAGAVEAYRIASYVQPAAVKKMQLMEDAIRYQE